MCSRQGVELEEQTCQLLLHLKSMRLKIKRKFHVNFQWFFWLSCVGTFDLLARTALHRYWQRTQYPIWVLLRSMSFLEKLK